MAREVAFTTNKDTAEGKGLYHSTSGEGQDLGGDGACKYFEDSFFSGGACADKETRVPGSFHGCSSPPQRA